MTFISIEKIAAVVAIIAVVVGATWTVATRTTESEQRIMLENIKKLEREIVDINKIKSSETIQAQLDTQENIPDKIGDNNDENYSLKFTQPQDGEIVQQASNISYSLSGNIPEGSHVVLIIKDPLRQYWSWGQLRPNEVKRVQLGIARDTGEEFTIGLLVTEQEFPVNQPTYELPKHSSFTKIDVKRN